MRCSSRMALVSVGLALCSCSRDVADDAGRGGPHGRYSGVGIYAPSPQWTKLSAIQQPNDPQSARPADDQVIIVVQDSTTGEVRACGDLTGYCIGMNPWKKALVAEQVVPVKVTEHIAPSEPNGDAAPDATGNVAKTNTR